MSELSEDYTEFNNEAAQMVEDAETVGTVNAGEYGRLRVVAVAAQNVLDAMTRPEGSLWDACTDLRTALAALDTPAVESLIVSTRPWVVGPLSPEMLDEGPS